MGKSDDVYHDTGRWRGQLREQYDPAGDVAGSPTAMRTLLACVAVVGVAVFILSKIGLGLFLLLVLVAIVAWIGMKAKKVQG